MENLDFPDNFELNEDEKRYLDQKIQKIKEKAPQPKDGSQSGASRFGISNVKYQRVESESFPDEQMGKGWTSEAVEKINDFSEFVKNSRREVRESEFETFNRQIMRDSLNENDSLTPFAMNKFEAMKRSLNGGNFQELHQKIWDLYKRYKKEMDKY